MDIKNMFVTPPLGKELGFIIGGVEYVADTL